jgi:hypothetical protein
MAEMVVEEFDNVPVEVTLSFRRILDGPCKK